MSQHGFGGTGYFPFTLGGGDEEAPDGSIIAVEHQALLKELEEALDGDASEGFNVEANAWAQVSAIIWAVNRRLKGWLRPDEMLESLPIWEESTSLRPNSKTTDTERRSRVAGKLLGLVNNAIGDMETTSSRVLGAAFDGLVLVDPADHIVYWPGINPGPPGFEWSTNRVRIGIRIDKTSLTDESFEELRQALFLQLDAMVPSWMSFVIGTSDGFVVGIGIVGQTFL